MRCWVYVDGFNFYNGACRRLGCKWIDLLSLSQKLRPNDTIDRIKYFTALVEKRPTDPDQRKRQRLYWRALATLPCVQKIDGYFSQWEKTMPLCSSVKQIEADAAAGVDVVGRKPEMAKVLRSEEKGSDVNLAAHLVHDAHRGAFEIALILSTDADLAEAIRIVTQEVGKPVLVCRPNPNDVTRLLDKAATRCFNLTPAVLRLSTFPSQITDAKGTFAKPQSW